MRGQELLEGDPVRRADGLPLLLLQHAGLLRRGRDAARARDPAPRAVPAHDPPRAQPVALAPVLARDHGARPRRDLDALVRAARARHDPRPVRDVDRPADAHPLLPGRRRLRGHPGRLRAEAARLLRRDADRIDQYEALVDRNEIFLQRTKGVGIVSARAPARARRHRARCCAPPASPGTCARPTPYLAYGDVDFKIPVGTVGDGYDRYRVPHAGDARVGADHRAVPRRPARGAVDRRRPQGRAAAARRALDLDGGADPPLQARHRGLPGAAGRGLLPDRVARAASSAATCSPTARRSRRGSTSATRRSSTCRRCATCRSAATSPT